MPGSPHVWLREAIETATGSTAWPVGMTGTTGPPFVVYAREATSREQVLDAIANYPGAIVLVTHDPGAVLALKPDRAILLPDGDEDAWSDDLLELVELA